MKRKIVCGALFGGVAMLGLASAANAAISLGTASDFAVLTVPDGSFITENFSNVTVNGNVGIGTTSKLLLAAPSTVNGNVYFEDVAAQSASTFTGTITGTNTVNGPKVSQAIADALACYNAAILLAPDTTIGNLTSNQTINGSGGQNVIRITGDVNLNSESLTLTGGPNDFFIIQLLGDLDLVGSGGIVAGSGMDASRILIVVESSGKTLTTHVGNELDGTLLAPYDDLTFHSVNGAVFAGGGTNENVTLMSGATVTGNPFTPPNVGDTPEPASLGILALGAVGLLARRRRA